MTYNHIHTYTHHPFTYPSVFISLAVYRALLYHRPASLIVFSSSRFDECLALRPGQNIVIKYPSAILCPLCVRKILPKCIQLLYCPQRCLLLPFTSALLIYCRYLKSSFMRLDDFKSSLGVARWKFIFFSSSI